ncbi:MAG: spore germination protein [Bacillota bacterium]
MFNRAYRKIKKLLKQNKQAGSGDGAGSAGQQPLAADLGRNIQELRSIFERCSDVVMRQLVINGEPPVDAFLVYIDGMVDVHLISDHVMRALQMNPALVPRNQRLTGPDAFSKIKDSFIGVVGIKTTSDMQQLVRQVVYGDAGLLIDGVAAAMVINARQWESRTVEESNTEPVVRGPRDGFTEKLRTNTTLVRRRIKSHRLKMENYKIGQLTQTDVVVAYIDGIANDKVVEEVRRRLKRIKIDGILESGYIEELIEDQPYSIFPQVNVTERPDKLAANLLEGYVAIMVDNTPVTLIVPVTVPFLLQSSEDYYNRYLYAIFVRMLRFLALNIALLLPSLYIAITTYHQEMLPTLLFISIASQREGMPFPAFVEALFMETVFEILREAGIRLPRQIGQAVSIVGALVIGDAAVKAGLVSPAIVMVVALTAIASFTIPNYSASFSIRILRFPIMVLAAILGLFGIMTALMVILYHLCSLRSFGVPYLSPLAPINFHDMQDTIIRMPRWSMFQRPQLVAYKDPRRMSRGQKPGPGRQDKGDRGDA